MAKGTLIFIIILGLIASLLLGFRLGKNSNNSLKSVLPTIMPSISLTPVITKNEVQVTNFESNTSTSASNPKTDQSGKSVFTDQSCGFRLSFPSSFLNSKTNNGQSSIITNPDDPTDTIVTACLAEIPKPPLPTDKIENITLDGVTAKLYHDSSAKDGSPRDEIIVNHPTNGMQIIIAGYGPTFNSAISTFKFI